MCSHYQAAMPIALLAAVLLVAGCKPTPTPTPLPYVPPPQPSPSITGQAAVPTYTSQPRSSDTPQPPPTATPSPYPQVMCTPPLCKADEVFHCPDSCPGGCGTECATRTPTPTLLPGQSRLDLNGPVLVDSDRGQLYVPGWPDGRPADAYQPDATDIFVLDARNMRVLASYPMTGSAALDSTLGFLYLDQESKGITVLDASTGVVRATVLLPSLTNDWEQSPAPIADPISGTLLAFRNNIVYIIDPQKGAVLREVPFDVRKDGGSCSTFDGPLTIDRAHYDAGSRRLYAAFLAYTCTPWFGYTIVAYDMTAEKEIARWGSLPFTATAVDGKLYGSSWHRFGIGYNWIWEDGRFTAYSANWGGGLSSFTVDRKRGRLYQATTHDIRVYDSETMTLQFVVPNPSGAGISTIDPKTERLYLVREGELQVLAADAIQPPPTEPLIPTTPPAKPVKNLLVSSGWPGDRTLFGTWGGEILLDGCYVFGQMAELPLISTDGGQTWSQPVGGLRGACSHVAAIAMSPDYPRDKTLFAVVVGLGPFKSTDGGRLWKPISAGLSDIGVQNLLVSPDYADDQTLFGQVSGERPGMVFKSTNGGRIWSQLPETNLSALALSPEYGLDHIMMAATGGEQSELKISRDGGYAWDTLGNAPGEGSVSMLSLAPLFQKWETIFVLSSNGMLYRSWIGGSHWQAVLQTLPNAQIASIAYGTEEVNRPVFLVVAAQTNPGDPLSLAGTLYRSRDGGINWESIPLPEGVQPTAAAFWPDATRGGVLFVGTADGRVLQGPVAE